MTVFRSCDLVSFLELYPVNLLHENTDKYPLQVYGVPKDVLSTCHMYQSKNYMDHYRDLLSIANLLLMQLEKKLSIYAENSPVRPTKPVTKLSSTNHNLLTSDYFKRVKDLLRARQHNMHVKETPCDDIRRKPSLVFSNLVKNQHKAKASVKGTLTIPNASNYMPQETYSLTLMSDIQSEPTLYDKINNIHLNLHHKVKGSVGRKLWKKPHKGKKTKQSKLHLNVNCNRIGVKVKSKHDLYSADLDSMVLYENNTKSSMNWIKSLCSSSRMSSRSTSSKLDSISNTSCPQVLDHAHKRKVDYSLIIELISKIKLTIAIMNRYEDTDINPCKDKSSNAMEFESLNTEISKLKYKITIANAKIKELDSASVTLSNIDYFQSTIIKKQKQLYNELSKIKADLTNDTAHTYLIKYIRRQLGNDLFMSLNRSALTTNLTLSNIVSEVKWLEIYNNENFSESSVNEDIWVDDESKESINKEDINKYTEYDQENEKHLKSIVKSFHYIKSTLSRNEDASSTVRNTDNVNNFAKPSKNATIHSKSCQSKPRKGSSFAKLSTTNGINDSIRHIAGSGIYQTPRKAFNKIMRKCGLVLRTQKRRKKKNTEPVKLNAVEQLSNENNSDQCVLLENFSVKNKDSVESINEKINKLNRNIEVLEKDISTLYYGSESDRTGLLQKLTLVSNTLSNNNSLKSKRMSQPEIKLRDILKKSKTIKFFQKKFNKNSTDDKQTQYNSKIQPTNPTSLKSSPQLNLLIAEKEKNLFRSIQNITLSCIHLHNFYKHTVMDLACHQCLYLINKPTQLWSCGHTFCHQCIVKFSRNEANKDSLICPECHMITEHRTSPNTCVNNIIECYFNSSEEKMDKSGMQHWILTIMRLIRNLIQLEYCIVKST